MNYQDFRLLALELHNIKPKIGDNIHDHFMWQKCVDAVAKACRTTNIRFRQSHFQNMCNQGENKGKIHRIQ